MRNEQGLAFHLHIKEGDVGRYVLLPGDPARSEKIAAFFDAPHFVAQNREYVTWTGTLLGEKVSVVSTAVILLTSLLLSGFAGMKALINLLTRWGVGNSVTAPETMINWRMVEVNLSTLTQSTLTGWIVMGLGISLTVLAVYFPLKHCLSYGSPEWVVSMLGVFAASLAVTWHAHYHMAVVLIPFLIYASVFKLLPLRNSFLWVVVTPAAWLEVLLVGALTIHLLKINIFDSQLLVIALSGFVVNLVVLYATLRFLKIRSMQQ